MSRAGVTAVDLFCGGGGTSTGLARACCELGVPVELIAINHWDIAIATHTANHPWATHLCAKVEAVDPTEVVPGGRLSLVVASPECTHYSVARGGKPKQDQKRASPWFILPWLSRLYVDAVLIENVPEFRTWGPLGANGQPLKRHRGETFKAFIHAIQSHGYSVSYQVLNAADYGDATSRRRLFILARRGNHIIHWPRPSHSKGGKVKGTSPWRAAREIIDWSLEGESVFTRKRPLAPATMRRILAGLDKFGGPELKPFLVVLRGTEASQLEASAKSVDEPVPGIAANGNHVALVQMTHGGRELDPDAPLPTITAAHRGEIGVAKAFVLPPEGVYRGNQARDVDEPLPTITAGRGGEIGLVKPFILPPAGFHQEGGDHNPPRSVDEPLQTITRRGGGHLVEAHIQSHFGERDGQAPRVHSIEDPLPTITQRGPALIEGVLVDYHGQSTAHSIEEPVPTLTSRQLLGLVQPVLNGYKLDIRFRMLQPHELAAAMGFESGYAFTGNRQEVVRQIGNAVAVNMAKALCLSLLNGQSVEVEGIGE